MLFCQKSLAMDEKSADSSFAFTLKDVTTFLRLRMPEVKFL